MNYGIRLTGTLRDLASLQALSTAYPALVARPWSELTPPAGAAPDGAQAVITSDGLDLSVAQTLRSRGVDVVRVAWVDRGLRFVPLKPSRKLDLGEVWADVQRRDAGSLVEALRPLRVKGDPVVSEAILRVPLTSESAQKTLERLLALGRDDFQVSEIDDASEGARVLLLRVPTPPMYLLLRSREEPGEGVTAYARAGDGDLWVAWGYEHPLAPAVSRRLKELDRMALVDASGTWRYAPAVLPSRSIYDVIVPKLEAPRAELSPAEGVTRFRIRLRLGAAAQGEPELWLLDPEQFLGLEPLVETLSADEVTRFTVSRMTDGARTTYVLQEIVRPNVPRLATRVSDLLGVQGFTRAPGTDNLYLPLGRQLLPRMRRDELRALLGLDQARAVVVDEDRDGPRVVTVQPSDEVSLSKWVEYVATDRRTELERLDERSVFDWPELTVERPPREKESRAERNARDEPPPPPRIQRRERKVEPVAIEAPAPLEDNSTVNAALREEIRGLEKTIAGGGCDEAETWQRLGALKLRTQEHDDACACLEAALFHGADDLGLASTLAATRLRIQGSLTGTDKELVELVTRTSLSPAEGAYLGARVIEKALRRDSVGDVGFFQSAERLFLDDDIPVSRRLAWAVERTLHARASDRLGLTRAKERLLGGLNDRGLVETTDMPRFVRFALALEVEGPGGVLERNRAEQLTALEDLWRVSVERHIHELEPKGAYLRLVFSIGFMRLGAPARARDILVALDAEESVHERPNQILFKLYRARGSHIATQGDAAAWAREVEGILATVKEPRVRDRIEWLRKRSEWLRSSPIEDSAPGIRPMLERQLAEAEAAPSRAASTLGTVMDDRSVFDYEVGLAIKRLLRAALRSGNDDTLSEVLAVATRRLSSRISIPSHRARAIGLCIQATATLGDSDGVDKLLDEIVALAGAPETPSTRDLIDAVTPGLAALRRLGVSGSARRFLDALVPLALRGQREGVRLRAALADGFLQLREVERAEQLIDQCLEDTLEGSLDHVGRYEAGVAVLGALKHWPMVPRALRCRTVLEGIDRFTDTFTAWSQQKLYETHKVLIAERIVDAVADDVTFQGDKVRGFLDEEEQSIRRKIIADWRQVCGR